MKLNYLFSCFFCLLFLPLVHADDTAAAPLKVEGLKDSYTFPAPITVKVTNIGQSLVVYGVGIQEKLPDRWQDFMTNIDDHEPIRMEFKLRKIKAGESQLLTWEPKFVPKTFGTPKGTYRVYIIWDAAGENDHRKFYSEPFKIDE